MPTTFVKGDIFADPGDGSGKHAFAFAASTDGTLDAGIGVAFAKRHPELAVALEARAAGGEISMGEVVVWEKDGTTVFVLALLRKAKPAKVSHVTQALQSAVAKAQSVGITRLAVPRIGGGKTDLDWTRVKRVLGEVGEKAGLDLVVYEQFIRGAGAAVTAAEAGADGEDAGEG
jgi:O-acetyl-ADP-ribose deacetylase (regulator of RNase III)